jgi:hypothetical protein
VKERDDELRRALDALLGDEPGADPAEVARLRKQLHAAGEALRARAFQKPRDEVHFVRRVLANTLRAEGSPKGRSTRFLDRLRSHLQGSRGLHTAAASLALAGTAALALHWWPRGAEAPERNLAEADEPAHERALEVLETEDATATSDLFAVRQRGTLARATERFLAQESGRRSSELLVPSAASEGLTLARRVAGLRGLEPGASAPAAADTFATALWLEGELDQLHARGGSASSTARRLAVELAERQSENMAPELATLVAATLKRAFEEGLIDAAPAEPPAVRSPAWFEALDEASHGLSGDEPERVQRWLVAARAK